MQVSIRPGRRLRLLSFAIVAILGGWVLYTFPPTRYGFYPRCPFNLMTGLQCPGCGTTRALHHLLHGRIREAFHLNALLFVLIPVTLCALPSLVRGRAPQFLMKPWFAWSAFFVLMSYWIVRNTPFYPF